MVNLCIVITSDYSKCQNDEERALWETEAEFDKATIKEAMPKETQIFEIKIDVFSKNTKVEDSVDEQLPDLSLKDANNCHIIINSHGNIVKKDLQDTAIKKVIERVSELGIPISQMTALVCYAMAEDNAEEARKRQINKLGHTAAYKQALKKTTAMDVLISRINKMELTFRQTFKIWGPISAYDPDSEKELVIATLKGELVVDESNNPENQFRAVSTNYLSLDDYKLKIKNSLEWIKVNLDPAENSKVRLTKIMASFTEDQKKEYEDIGKKHISLLGSVLLIFRTRLSNINHYHISG